jgi:hypothetical protein
MEPLPVVLFVILLLIPLAIIIGVAVSLKQRFEEIKGGEEDAVSKY